MQQQQKPAADEPHPHKGDSAEGRMTVTSPIQLLLRTLQQLFPTSLLIVQYCLRPNKKQGPVTPDTEHTHKAVVDIRHL